MSFSRNNINSLFSSLIVEELVRNGIDYFVISPGSRSAPMTSSVAENSRAKDIIIYDERSAAFHAIGYAKGCGKPAVLICTSGSAVGNYLPAVIEADISKIPLIIISADRPTELRDVGANQSINQRDIFKPYIRYGLDLEAPNESIPLKYILTLTDSLVNYAVKGAGAVHLNIMFREPLAPTIIPFNNNILMGIEDWEQSSGVYTEYINEVRTLSDETIEFILDGIKEADNPLFIIGRLPFGTDRELLIKLIERLKIPVFADILSGLRMVDNIHIINYYDQILLDEKMVEEKPDFVLHIGGQLTSKRLLQCLDCPIERYIVLKEHSDRHDPNNNITHRICSDYNSFFVSMVNKTNEMGIESLVEDRFGNGLKSKNGKINNALNDLKIPEANEVMVARLVSEEISSDEILFLSSSMPVRDMDMFANIRGGKDENSYEIIEVDANRGASGIDGIISTASGIMVGRKRDCSLVIGDIAFIYDMNVLSYLDKIENKMTIVLINNGGGGIFSFLPISEKNKNFEKYFATPHSFNFGGISNNFNIEYRKCESMKDFRMAYCSRNKVDRHLIIEVVCDRESNIELHRSLKGLY